jgi:hypothetical protein
VIVEVGSGQYRFAYEASDLTVETPPEGHRQR